MDHLKLIDIERMIETNLLCKLKTNNLKLLKKTQNIYRLLLVHETLLNILFIIEEYDKESSLISIICNTLYYFAYKNSFNQKILKKKFDCFLGKILNQSYSKVVTEIVNSVKENQTKSKKYIKKIFSKFNFENNELMVELFSVLHSFTFNNNEENLAENQVIVY